MPRAHAYARAAAARHLFYMSQRESARKSSNAVARMRGRHIQRASYERAPLLRHFYVIYAYAAMLQRRHGALFLRYRRLCYYADVTISALLIFAICLFTARADV